MCWIEWEGEFGLTTSHRVVEITYRGPEQIGTSEAPKGEMWCVCVGGGSSLLLPGHSDTGWHCAASQRIWLCTTAARTNILLRVEFFKRLKRAWFAPRLISFFSKNLWEGLAAELRWRPLPLLAREIRALAATWQSLGHFAGGVDCQSDVDRYKGET